MFDATIDKLNAKLDEELQKTATSNLDTQVESKFSHIKEIISDFQVDSESSSNERNLNSIETVFQGSSNFRKLKDYIETLKVDKYSLENRVKTMKKKLRISEEILEEERLFREKEEKKAKDALLKQKAKWQEKMDKALEDKRLMGVKVEELVEYINSVIKSNFKIIPIMIILQILNLLL